MGAQQFDGGVAARFKAHLVNKPSECRNTANLYSVLYTRGEDLLELGCSQHDHVTSSPSSTHVKNVPGYRGGSDR